MPMLFRRSLSVALLLFAPSAALSAQSASRANVLTVNVLSEVILTHAVEYEHVSKPSRSDGGGVTWWVGNNSNGTLRYASFDLKRRWYPSGAAPKDFSVGLSVGYVSVNGVDVDGDDETGHGPSVGALLERQWFPGSADRIAFVLGGGIKAILVEPRHAPEGRNFAPVYPTIRFSVGYAW
jgi:hypothetical protein